MKNVAETSKRAYFFIITIFVSISNCFAQCDTCYIKIEQTSTCKDGFITLKAMTNGTFEGWFDLEGNLIDVSKTISFKSEISEKVKVKAKYDKSTVLNESFELGNTGFESDYSYFAGSSSKNSYYIVGANPKSFVSAYIRQKDVTSGNGNMLIVDGNTNNSKAAYRTFINATQDNAYQISLWASNIHEEFTKSSPDTSKQNIPVIQVFIDDSLKLTYPMPLDTVWHELKLDWISAKTSSVKFEIKTKSTSVKGNDFAVDDIKIASSITISDSIITQPCNNLEPIVTPDGDGHYDTYFIQEAGLAKVIDLDGNVINELNSPANWDGTSKNGSIADAGYYAIVVNNKIYRVSLIR